MRRPRMEEYLPTDVLEAILGLLDLETLCTARLVSRRVCAAASAHIRTLTLDVTSRASLDRFPRLEHVAAHYRAYRFGEEERFAGSDPRLRDRINTLEVRGRASITEILPQVALMPKLRDLDIWVDMTHGASLLRRCTQLESLRLLYCSKFVATRVVQMTRLTSLHIGMVSRVGDKMGIRDASWLEQATKLQNLQALYIEPSEGALPLVGNLTGLTGLTMYDDDPQDDSLAPLTRLTRLRSLDINWDLSESNLGIACSLGSGSLVNLRVRFDWEASAEWGRFLLPQTALTRLVVCGWPLCNMQHIGALRLELLRSLELYHLYWLDGEGVSALCKATSLTHLVIEADEAQTYQGLSQALPRLPQLLSLELHLHDGGVTQPHMGLTQAVARLTHLRSFEVALWGAEADAKVLNLPMALSPLTGLTRLELGHGGVDNEDVRALLGLTGLRELKLTACFAVNDDVVPELGALTNLHTLRVANCGVTSLAAVTGVLDPLREARGLKPMRTDLHLRWS